MPVPTVVEKKKIGTCLLIFLNVVHLSISAIFPIFNREMFFELPYPFYLTFVQMASSIPVAGIAAWIAKGCPPSIGWIKPPSPALTKLIFSGVLFGGMMLTGNFGFYVSSVDFAILFRISTIIFSSLLGLLFLGESVSFFGAISIMFVMFGIIFLSTNFQWSTARMPSTLQLVVQTSAVLTSSLSAFTLKKAIKAMEQTERGQEPITMMMWRYFFGCMPVLIVSLIMEPGVWLNFSLINTKQVLVWTLTGIGLSGTFQFVSQLIHQYTALVTIAVIAQIKFIPTLVISHIRYRETKWTLQQIIGVFFLMSGSTAYSLSRIESCQPQKKSSTESGMSDPYRAGDSSVNLITANFEEEEERLTSLDV